VRGQCLALSLRHWDIGQHGVWGGLVAADRAQLRARLRAGRTGRPRDRRCPGCWRSRHIAGTWRLMKEREVR
jgi:hypothetical protein